MDLPIRDIPAHPGNYGGKRRASDIRYLVVHYTGNDGDTAERNARYFQDTVSRTSAHYFVDDGEIIK